MSTRLFSSTDQSDFESSDSEKLDPNSQEIADILKNEIIFQRFLGSYRLIQTNILKDLLDQWVFILDALEDRLVLLSDSPGISPIDSDGKILSDKANKII